MAAITSTHAANTDYAGSTNSAASRVFGTYELLENVLSHLPTKDLVQAQQVNVDFHSVTARSKLLRQNLFLEPEQYKPLSQETYPFHPDFFAPDEYDEIALPQPHPFLETSFGPYAFHKWGGAWTYTPEWEDVKRMLSWSKGQWEQMLITQPPTTETAIFAHQRFSGIGGGRCVPRTNSAVVEDISGIRLGKIVSIIHELFEVEGREGVEWDDRIDHWMETDVISLTIFARRLSSTTGELANPLWM